MKQKILLLIMILLVSGCVNSKKVEEDKIKELKNKLTIEAKKIFEIDEWTKGGINEGTYTVTLKDLKEKMNINISDYKNPTTNKLCDLDKTKIDFIVSKQQEPDKTNYKFKITIVCQ